MIRGTYLSILFISLSNLVFGQAFNMTLESSWDNTSYQYNDIWGYTDDFGNEYAILGSRTRIIFFDITTPSSPVFLEEFSGDFPGISGANSLWRDIKTFDRYAYTVADQGSEGLMVFDLTDIHNGNITKVNQLNSEFIQSHNIFIDVPKGKLYVTGSDTQSNGLIIYDISEDPSNPVHLSSVSLSGGYVHDLYVLNDTAYCSSGNDGLYIFDMTSPSSPNFLSFDESAADGYNHSNWPFDNGDKMLVAEEVPQGLELAIFDISDPDDISFSSSFRDPVNTSGSGFPTYHNPYMVGDYAVVSSYQDGVTIMDLSDTSNPFRAAHYDTFSNSNYGGYQGCWGTYPYFPSATIIGSDISTGLYVLSTTLNLTNTCNNGIQDDFEVDIDCGGFCNTCECSAPRDIVFSNINASTIQIDWTDVNTSVGYELRYRINGSSNWTNVSTSTNTIVVSGLIPTTSYDFQFRSDCGTRFTPYNSSVTYTLGDCFNDEFYTGDQSSGVYVADKYIKSNASIKIGSTVEYLTGDSIILENPFTIGQNSGFLAEVNRPCGVVPFTGQGEIENFINLEAPILNEAYTSVVNLDEQVVYVISNLSTNDSCEVHLLDQMQKVIQTISLPKESKMLKIPLKSEMNKILIQEGENRYILPLE